MSEDTNPGGPPPSASDMTSGEFSSALERFLLGRESNSGPLGAVPKESESRETFVPGVAIEPCPEPGDWALLLGHPPHPEDSTKVSALLAHATACSDCSRRLRTLSAAASPLENSVLAKLSSASAIAQVELAAELARTPRVSEPRQFRRLYYWTGAGLAAALLIALGLVSWWRLANNPEHLMAEAYTQARIFELRMPDAGYAQVSPARHLRGAAASREPSSLLQAQEHIERQLKSAPADSHWLQLEARSDILEEKYDPAIDIIERLVATGPVNASLLLDDASAYFERGQATGSESDRATALDYLRRADELAPGDPVVLFNEAIVMEDRGQLVNAVETWNRYLRLEHDVRWKQEGRQRLQALEQKLNQLKSHGSS